MSGHAARIETALLEFVEQHSAGTAPDLDTFCERYTPDESQAIRDRIRQFLAFDAYLDADDGEEEPVPPPPRQESAGIATTTDGGHAVARTLGDFAIEEELGAGGMGIVYRAVQRPLGRQVALKVLSRGLGLSERYTERFRREAAAAARLEHPGIVRVFAFGEDDGVTFFAMELVRGESLHEVLERVRGAKSLHLNERPHLGVLDRTRPYTAEVAELIAQIGDALAAAHTAQIVHRDIKTRNVMLDDDGRARVLDFGLAKDAQDVELSWTGEVSGTPHAMSPEQTGLRDGPVDARTDIFALGGILYEFLTLRRPFAADGDAPRIVLDKIAHDAPEDIRKLCPQTPKDLCTICEKALEKDPKDRYATAADFAADLRRFLRFEPILAQPPTPFERLCKTVRRHRGRVAAAVAGVLLLMSWLSWTIVDTASRRARADTVFARADTLRDAGNASAAADEAFAALEFLPNDEGVRARVDRYRLAATERSRLLTESTVARARDPELALRITLEAASYGVDHTVRTAALEALARFHHSRALTGHRDSVTGAKFSPDGRWVATASHDRNVLLHDLRMPAGQPAAPVKLVGHRHWVRAFAFSGDGKRLVSGSVDRHARVWDLDSGLELAALRHPAEVRSIAVGPKGNRIVTAAGDHSLRLWDLQRPTPLVCQMRGHTRRITAMHIEVDRDRAVTASPDGTLRLWDLAAGHERSQATIPDAWPTRMAVLDDWTLCAIATRDGRVFVYRIEGDRLVPLTTLRHPQQVQGLAFAPRPTAARRSDGKAVTPTLATASWDHSVRLWDPVAGIELQILAGHSGDVHDLAFRQGSTSSLQLVTASEDRTARIWDVTSGTELSRLEHPDPVYAVAFDPSGERVLTHHGKAGVRVWDLESPPDNASASGTAKHLDTAEPSSQAQPIHAGVLRIHGAKERVQAIAFDPDPTRSPRLATGSNDRFVRIYDATRGTLLHAHELDDAVPHCLAFAPDGDHLLVAHGRGVDLIAIESGETIRSLAGHQGAVRIARYIGPDRRRIATGCEDGVLRMFRGDDARFIRAIDCTSQVRDLVVSTDGKLAVVLEAERTRARVLDVFAGGVELAAFGPHDSPLQCLAQSPGGDLVALADRTGSVSVWRLSTYEKLTGFDSGHTGAIRAMCFLDEDRLATASSDGTARILDWQTGQPRLTWSGHAGRIYALAVSPQGTRIATGSRDRTAQLWPTNPLEIARRLDLRSMSYDERLTLGRLRPLDREAATLVETLSATHLLRSTLIQAIESNSVVDDTVRNAALTIAQSRLDPPADTLRSRASRLCQTPCTPLEAERALRLAEAACSLDPQNGYHHGTAGAALYRLGRHAAARTRLTRANTLLKRARRSPSGGFLAFLAMCEHQLDNPSAAQEATARFESLFDGESDPARQHRWRQLRAEIQLQATQATQATAADSGSGTSDDNH